MTYAGRCQYVQTSVTEYNGVFFITWAYDTDTLVQSQYKTSNTLYHSCLWVLSIKYQSDDYLVNDILFMEMRRYIPDSK